MPEPEILDQNYFTPTNRYLLSGCNFISCRWCLNMVSLLSLKILYLFTLIASLFLKISRLQQCVVTKQGAKKQCQFTWRSKTACWEMTSEWAVVQHVRSDYQVSIDSFIGIFSSFIRPITLCISAEYTHCLFRKFVFYFAG